MGERLMVIYFKFFAQLPVKNSFTNIYSFKENVALFRELNEEKRQELYRRFYYQHIKRLLFKRHARQPPNPSHS